VERYIDTPVKRYSSGMYVRLAFAVAAHLEPEILIIDEVLSVGDADFQKKCLGKMKDVAGEGRTVLFVSHNMTAVKSLCPNSIMLKHGEIVKRGPSGEVIDAYLNDEKQFEMEKHWDSDNAPGNDKVRLLKAALYSEDLKSQGKLTVESEIEIEFIFENHVEKEDINLSVHFCSLDDFIVFASVSHVIDTPGKFLKFRCKIPSGLLNSMMYKADVLYVVKSKTAHIFTSCLQFEIQETERKGSAWFGRWPGVVRPLLKWEEESNLLIKKEKTDA
jgi:lipopolysaccharide transport system ATP-binding protein